MTDEERSAAKCYVVMCGEDAAGACIVIDGTPKKDLAKFLRENVGDDICTVTVAEARVLLGNYFSQKAKQKAVEPVQLDIVDAIEKAEAQ